MNNKQEQEVVLLGYYQRNDVVVTG